MSEPQTVYIRVYGPNKRPQPDVPVAFKIDPGIRTRTVTTDENGIATVIILPGTNVTGLWLNGRRFRYCAGWDKLPKPPPNRIDIELVY